MGGNSTYNLFCCCGPRKPEVFIKSACIALLALSIFFVLETIGTLVALGIYAKAAGGTYIFFGFDLAIIIYGAVCLCQIKKKEWNDIKSFGVLVLVLAIIRLIILIISFLVTLIWVGILNIFVSHTAEGQKLVGSILAVIMVLYGISIILVSWSISLASNLKAASRKLSKKEKKDKKKKKKAAKAQQMGNYNAQHNQHPPNYNYQAQPGNQNNPYTMNNQGPQYPPQQQPPVNYYNPNAPPQQGQGQPPQQGQGYPPQGQAYPPQGQAYPPQGQAYPPQNQGFPPQVQGQNPYPANTGNPGFVNTQNAPLQKKGTDEGL